MDAFTAEEVPQTAEEVRRCSGPCTVAGGRATAVPILSLWRRERKQIDGLDSVQSHCLLLHPALFNIPGCTASTTFCFIFQRRVIRG